METSAVPFNVTREGGDDFVSIETRGVLRAEADAIVIEYVDSATDYSSVAVTPEQGPVHEVRIPLREVDSVAYGRRTLRSSMLELRCSRMAALSDVPFADGNRFTVRIARADRDRARDFAASVTRLKLLRPRTPPAND